MVEFQEPMKFGSDSVTSTWSTRSVVITAGHPFYVAFVWGNAPAAPS